jgi:hypothetical protein
VPKSVGIVLWKQWDNVEDKLAHSQAKHFHKTIKVIEGNDKCATESAVALNNLLLKLQTRCDEHFIPHTAKLLI